MNNKPKTFFRKEINSADKTKKHQRIFIKGLAGLLLAVFLLGNLPGLQVGAAGNVTGTVYYDYNGNGTINSGSTTLANDNGVVGVVVTAYNTAGLASGTATTGTAGTYTLATTGTGPYRIEFSNLPAGFSPSAFGANNGTTVQFAPEGGASGINLGIVNNTIYSQDNPNLVTPIMVNGNPLGGGNSGTSNWLAVFPYNSTGRTALPQTFNGTVLGATWGQAYQRATRRLYSAAVVKRNVGLGSYATDGSNGATLNQTGGRTSGTGGIYVTDFAAATPAPAQFVNLQNLGVNTGNFAVARNLPADVVSPSVDGEAFAAVGKRGIGDIDLSEDGNTLWAVNLNNRTLVSMNVAGGAVPTAATEYTVISSLAGAPTCTNGVLRPYALAFRNSLGYLGAVCTGENSGTAADLRAYVLSFNPANPNAGFTQLLNVPLNYARGFATDRASNSKQWFPWRDVYTDAEFRPTGTTNDSGAGGLVIAHPTPMLSDIEFDNNGAMILGFTDRVGNQFGHLQPRPVGTATDLMVAATGGEILRAQSNGNGGYAIENNGSVTGATGSGVSNAQGPGGGEFYAQDTFAAPNHEETGQGGLAQLQGGEIATTETDPLDYNSGGIGWMSNANGVNSRDYRVYIADGSTPGVQGKANGLGDLEMLSNVAPIQIGNRIWRDANGNGVQGANGLTGGAEAGIGGVSVQLYEDTNADNAADTLVSTATTDPDGQYYFGGNNCSETTVSVPIVASSDDAEQVVGAANTPSLTGLSLDLAYPGTNQNIVGLRFEGLSIPRGVTITGANIQFSTRTATTATVASVAIQGQADDNAPTFTADANNLDGRARTTATVNWSNIPGWETVGERGADQRTPDLSAIVQQIVNRTGWTSGNSMAFILKENGSTAGATRAGISFDDAGSSNAVRPVLTVTFKNNCYNVKPNTRYDVRVPATNFNAGQPLAGLVATRANVATQAGIVDNSDSDFVNTTNPTGSPAGTIPVASLTTGTFGANNHTFDAGFVVPASLGDTVFSDLDRDGVQDAGEPGINGVTVTLYGSDCTTVVTTTTTATVGADAGKYAFTGLLPETYCVGFTLPTGFGYKFTTANSTGATDLTDSDADPTTGKTGTYTLAAGDNNLTVDAGVVQTVSLGNQVFDDADNNGVRNAAETGIGGVTVNLYLDADNDNAPDSSTPVATTTTATTGTVGLYLFSGLAPNNYIVGVVTPANYVRSQTNGGDPDGNTDNDNNGITTVGAETRSNAVTLALATEPTAENPDNDAETPDANENLTVDFAFTAAYSLGNRVWFDTNNNGQIEAAAGNTELGIGAGGAGVSVSVFAASDTTFANALGTQTTDTSGYYRFDNLAAGDYVVRVNASNFADGAVLAGYTDTSRTDGTDLDSGATALLNGENGVNLAAGEAAKTVQTRGVVSGTMTLGGFSEPINETDVQTSGQGTADNRANMTVDFGFYRMCLSGTVWNDNGGGVAANNNNGFLNPNEPGVNAARVQIYSISNNVATEVAVGPDGILGTSDDAANGAVTASTGAYSFCGLPAGTYRVVVTTPNGLVSSTGTGNNANPDTNVDNDDNGFPNTNEGFTGKTISGTIDLTPGSETSSTGIVFWTNSNGVTANPTVDFGFRAAPTAVELEKFEAYTDGGTVELKWSTGNEANNLGFNLYREVAGKRELLNRAPVAGNALRSVAQLEANGGDYSWTVKRDVPGAVYYLEDIDTDGTQNLHGAITAQYRASLDKEPNAKTFADLANAENANETVEIVGSRRTLDATPKGKQLAALLKAQQQIAAAGGAKISVARDGWHRVTAAQLAAAGFDVRTNPQTWQLYADGAQVPLKLNSDSIEFFGRALDTPLTNSRAYYLVNASTNGSRINQTEGGAAGETADADGFDVTIERKDRAVYVANILNGDADNWFGAVVSRSQETVQNLNAANVDRRAAARLSVRLQGVVAGEHLVSVRFNDQPLGTVEFAGFENKQFEFELPASAVREGANTVVLQANGAPTDTSLVDALRLSYRRGYTAQDNRLRFTVPANQTVRVGGFDAQDISVYEIAGGAAKQQVVAQIENAGDGYGFSLSAASVEREMIAVTSAAVISPTVTKNAASAWNQAANQADFVIVTASELSESAVALGAMRQAQGLRTKVVLVEDLYDEFSFGRPEPNAVKAFLQTAASGWQTKPNYALLFGDSSYDRRNHLGLSETRDLVPTKLVDTEFMETASDAWLADFDNDGAEDIALGRLPIGNAAEARAAIEKLARFDAQAARAEKSNVLVSDRGFEADSDALQWILPGSVNAVRVDRAAADDDAATHQNLVARLNANPLLVTYTGHGSQNVWANSNVFKSADAAGLTNDQLSFYLLMNCLNGYTHQPTGESLAEALLKAPNAAIAVWTSSGITHPGNQAALSRAFTNFAFNAPAGNARRLGDVVRAAKQTATDQDVKRTWQLIGDPTTVIK